MRQSQYFFVFVACGDYKMRCSINKTPLLFCFLLFLRIQKPKKTDTNKEKGTSFVQILNKSVKSDICIQLWISLKNMLLSKLRSLGREEHFEQVLKKIGVFIFLDSEQKILAAFVRTAFYEYKVTFWGKKNCIFLKFLFFYRTFRENFSKG